MLQISLRGFVASPRAALRASPGRDQCVLVVHQAWPLAPTTPARSRPVYTILPRWVLEPRRPVYCYRLSTSQSFFSLRHIIRMRTRKRGRPHYCLTYITNFASCLKNHIRISLYISPYIYDASGTSYENVSMPKIRTIICMYVLHSFKQ